MHISLKTEPGEKIADVLACAHRIAFNTGSDVVFELEGVEMRVAPYMAARCGKGFQAGIEEFQAKHLRSLIYR